MGNIIGESFDPYVEDQIKLRQKKLGSINRDSNILAYTTSKTSWLRLSSGIDITDKKATELKIDTNLQANKLAKNYVLFGGANNITKSAFPKGGLASNYGGLDQNASYGFNSSQQYGLVPLPGIESAEILPKNRGSLRNANIVIKCYNKSQFDIIETLYMRLKYSILLEWGHTMYFENDDTLQTIMTDKVYSQFLDSTPIVIEDATADVGPNIPKEFNTRTIEEQAQSTGVELKSQQNKILNLIKAERKKTKGNYDGFLGWVTNFSWDLSSDGTYTINLKAISYGDIIESLSITKPLSMSPLPSSEDETPTGSPLETLLNRFKKILNRNRGWLSETQSSIKILQEEILQRNHLTNQYPRTYVDGIDLTEGVIQRILNTTSPFNTNLPNSVAKKELLGFNLVGGGETELFYIKLGSLLRIINNFFLVYDFSQPKNPPITSIDYNYDTTYCSCPKEILSSDIEVCIIPSDIDIEYKYIKQVGLLGRTNTLNLKSNLERLNEATGRDFLKKIDKNFGLPLHIHVNIDFIITQLKQNLDENGDLSLYDFLTSILRGINSALAGVIDLGVSYDEPTNTYYIIDNNPPKTLPDGLVDPPTKILVANLTDNGGSFAKSVSINSEISSKFATQIAIGAQANNKSLGSDSVAFSKWNEGLKDRLVPTKSYTSNPNTQTEGGPLPSIEDINKVGIYVYELDTMFIDRTRGVGVEGLRGYKPNIVNYLKVQRDIEVLDGSLSSKSFIPISLKIELDGLSGMKLYQKYSINDEILPRNYINNIEFIIKGLNHKIDTSGWTTTIEGFSIPKQKVQP